LRPKQCEGFKCLTKKLFVDEII